MKNSSDINIHKDALENENEKKIEKKNNKKYEDENKILVLKEKQKKKSGNEPDKLNVNYQASKKENIFGIVLKKNMMVILLMEKFMEMDI